LADRPAFGVVTSNHCLKEGLSLCEFAKSVTFAKRDQLAAAPHLNALQPATI